MNELILKLQTEAGDLVAKKKAAILAAEADGVSTEDAARHVAEAEAADAKLKDVDARLKRAVATRDQEDSLNAHLKREKEPATAPLVSRPFVPGNAAPNRPDPLSFAGQRRSGPLRMFKGGADAVGRSAEERAYAAGLFVAATQLGHAAAGQAFRERYGDLYATTLSTTSNTGAAYFVPDILGNDIVRLVEEYGVIRRAATVVPMSSDTYSRPRRVGGLTVTWVTEGSAPTQTEQKYDRVTLTAKDLAAYGKMTRQLQEDSLVSLGDQWMTEVALAFATAEDNAAFNGDGTSTYGGITGLLTKLIASANSASLVTATGHTTLGALTDDDFWAVVGKFPRYPGVRPKWYMHQEVYAASVGPLQTGVGGLTPQDLANGGIPKFLGYDIELVNAMPVAASVTSGVTGIIFGDLSRAVMLGDRRQMAMETDRMNDDLVKQLVTMFAAERVDINVHTVVDPTTSTKAGPVMGLKLG